MATQELILENVLFVQEGWYHPNCKSGQVHDHPINPTGNWSMAHHASCMQVYTMKYQRPNR